MTSTPRFSRLRFSTSPITFGKRHPSFAASAASRGCDALTVAVSDAAAALPIPRAVLSALLGKASTDDAASAGAAVRGVAIQVAEAVADVLDESDTLLSS